ncbi:MAG: chromosome segregation protein SMC [Cardiobacteriaceae bacterium]|nr:chromosome segregation protein SMC [Cardiobacteriaceae bacterium]
MQLKNITLHGFKSFADATTFPIQSALTGIIGPNGCGKSNIIDAVRWVLGENTAKHLRAGSGSDVIFGGSAKRKASHFAQVSLHFDNSDGTASGAFSVFNEIVISRKIQGDGQSTYLINQKVVRRRDIIELLQGAGVGARSYAVIEQGMISRIIEAKPEELRSFIEEAAGIALYKNRRRESEKRMEETEQYVLLHEERLKGLAKQRETLAQQASVAEQYVQLKTTHQAKQHRLRSFQYYQQNQSIEQLSLAIEREQSAFSTKPSEALKNELITAEQAFQDAQNAYQHKESLHQNSQHHHQQLLSEQRTEQTHQLHHQERAHEYERRLQRLHEQLAQNAENQAEQQSALILLKESIDSYQPELKSLRSRVQQQHNALQQEKQRFDQQQQTQHHLAQQLRHQQQQAATLRHNLQTWQQRLQTWQQSALPPLPSFDLEQWEQAKALEKTSQSAFEQAEQATEQALKTWQQAKLNAEASAQKLQRVMHQIEALNQSLPHRDLSEPLQALPPVFRELSIALPWQTALHRYLAPLLNAPCGNTPEHFQSALQDGKAYSSKGLVPVLWQEIIQGNVDLSLWLSHLTPLPLHDAEIEPEKLNPHTHYLTLDGTLLNTHSLQPQQADAHSVFIERLQALHDELPELKQHHEQQQQKAFEQQSLWQQCDEKRQLAHAQYQSALHERQRLDHEHHLWQQALQHREHLQQQQAQAQSALQEDVARGNETYAELQASIEHLQEQQQTLQEQQLDPETLTNAQSALQQAQTQLQHAEESQQQRQQQYSRQQALLESQQQHQTQQQAEIELITREQAQLQTLKEERQIRLEELSLALEESALALEKTQNQLQHAKAQAEACRQAFYLLEKQQQERQNAEQLQQERLKHLQQQRQFLQEQQSALLAEFEAEERKPLRFADDETLDTLALQQEIRETHQAMESLGAVNLSAVEEFGQISREHDELERQCHDLRYSMQLLKTAIQTLDQETRLRLKTTLEQVNQHFGALFPRLFHGGEAFLSWEEGDILEAGVNITVRPAGKKLKNITALSGGEKALSALALVFALFRLNPAPFCLLDEVDAPLDEANVGRLCALLQEMAQETQFVVITHHKKTMQQCERLIGVTMSEPGVSRLVAVEVGRG